jgi:hypothetical protein
MLKRRFLGGKMRFAIIHAIFLMLLLALTAQGAEKKKSEKALSDSELQGIAKKELLSAPARGKAAPPLSLEAPKLVSTSDILAEENKDRFASSEMEIGVQAYKPEGTGRISNTETYPLNRLSAAPMARLGLRYWFKNAALSSGSFRYGASLDGGIASQSLKLRTQSGATFDDVRLSTALLELGPEVEFFMTQSLALGLRVAAGRIFSVQATNAPVLNRSLQEGVWSISPHLRYQPTKNFFAKLGFAYRAILGNSEGLGTQASNVTALIGFGM